MEFEKLQDLLSDNNQSGKTIWIRSYKKKLFKIWYHKILRGLCKYEKSKIKLGEVEDIQSFTNMSENRLSTRKSQSSHKQMIV